LPERLRKKIPYARNAGLEQEREPRYVRKGIEIYVENWPKNRLFLAGFSDVLGETPLRLKMSRTHWLPGRAGVLKVRIFQGRCKQIRD
jgi:hypothetical protein